MASSSKNAQQTISGYVLFLPYAEGSRSESRQPFLVVDASQSHRLFSPGDHPFKHETLAPFHGVYCDVSGVFDPRRNVFLVAQIAPSKDPVNTTTAHDRQQEKR